MGAARVVDRLRDDIAHGVFSPNERLIELELTERYDAGRAAIRSAFVALEKEGLLDIEPNRGARVRHIPLAETLEITEIRRLLEGLCAARAAERATDGEIEELRGIIDEMRRFAKKNDIARYSKANARLHKRIYEIARHKTAADILDRLHLLTIRHQFNVSFLPGRIDVSLPEHAAIVDAIGARDPRRARRAAEQHLASVTEALKEVSRITGIGR